MGFKNKKEVKFVPIDLNEDNVQTIFNRCLATEKSAIIISSSLFPKEGGYDKPDTPITFSKEKIEKDLKNIRYLFGQIKCIHDDSSVMFSSTGAKKYTGENWTINSGNLMKLLHLGVASGLMYHFDAKSQTTGLVYIRPTLSPKDPKFEEWYKGYEATMKKSEGPTLDEK